jgi:hypothetical protein
VVVAVVAVGVVQVAAYQVIDVVAVRHRFVATAGAVAVPLLVLAAVVGRGAGRGVLGADRNVMFLHSARLGVVQVAVVQVIDVALVADARVPAARAVLVVMPRMVSLAHTRNLRNSGWNNPDR